MTGPTLTLYRDAILCQLKDAFPLGMNYASLNLGQRAAGFSASTPDTVKVECCWLEARRLLKLKRNEANGEEMRAILTPKGSNYLADNNL